MDNNIKSLPKESYRDRKPITIKPDTRTAEEKQAIIDAAEAALDARFNQS